MIQKNIYIHRGFKLNIGYLFWAGRFETLPGNHQYLPYNLFKTVAQQIHLSEMFY